VPLPTARTPAGLIVEGHQVFVNGRPVAGVRVEAASAGVLVPSKVELHRRFAYTDVQIELAALRPEKAMVTISDLAADGSQAGSYDTKIDIRARR
jgi:hypothetical protein